MPTYESLPVNRLAITKAATGDLVAAVTGKSIVVLNYLIVAAGAVSVNFESGTTDISGVMSMITGTPLAASDSEFGVLATAAGEKLAITLSGAVQVSGHLTYVVV